MSAVEPRPRRPLLEPHELLPGHVRGQIEPRAAGEVRVALPLGALDRAQEVLLGHGARFVGLMACERPERSLLALYASRGRLVALRAPLGREGAVYASLSLACPACRWPERELHDRLGVVPLGHPDLVPALRPDADLLREHVAGADVFAIPYGPIRSGVFEAIQFVIATGGEDVPHLETRPYFKHRGIEARFRGRTPEQAAYVAERVAGIASVAHAIAFAQAVERALGVEAPRRAALWRTLYAELERIANHLDVFAKEAETAALAVAQARMLILKENVLRLLAAMTGSRFARGAIVPGGMRAEGRVPLDGLLAALDRFEAELCRDRDLFLRTSSMTDRLIGSGTLERETVEAFAGVGPVARGSGISTDARFERPYAAYARVGFQVRTREDGDAMARIEVRFGEVAESLHILRQAIDALRRRESDLRVPLAGGGEGEALGWSEAPQGELVYWVEVAEGRVANVQIASPSLRNWALFAESFRGDVLTDFAFIEHSFGLTPAGADR